VAAARAAGCTQLALLKCTSAYPSPPEEMNLAAIPHLTASFGSVVGLSDHTLSSEVAVAAVALGASIVEKHFTLSRCDGGPDAAFSLEPAELAGLVRSIRVVEKAVGEARFAPTAHERGNVQFRRSLFVTEDVSTGAVFTEENVRSIRPGIGLAPRHYREVLGRKATRDIRRGTPLSWDMVAGS
jgi:pseudaminic acid synthase